MHFQLGRWKDEEVRERVGEQRACMVYSSALVMFVFFTVCFRKVEDHWFCGPGQEVVSVTPVFFQFFNMVTGIWPAALVNALLALVNQVSGAVVLEHFVVLGDKLLEVSPNQCDQIQCAVLGWEAHVFLSLWLNIGIKGVLHSLFLMSSYSLALVS